MWIVIARRRNCWCANLKSFYFLFQQFYTTMYMALLVVVGEDIEPKTNRERWLACFFLIVGAITMINCEYTLYRSLTNSIGRPHWQNSVGSTPPNFCILLRSGILTRWPDKYYICCLPRVFGHAFVLVDSLNRTQSKYMDRIDLVNENVRILELSGNQSIIYVKVKVCFTFYSMFFN